jgi:hypothetical protein
MFRKAKIYSMFFLLIIPFLSDSGNQGTLKKEAVFCKNIYLSNKEVFEFSNWAFELGPGRPSNSKNLFGATTEMLPPTPIIISSWETEKMPFSILRDYVFDEISEYSIINRLMSTNNFRYVNFELLQRSTLISLDEIISSWSYGEKYLLPFFHKIMSSKNARKELFIYFTTAYRNIQHLYPLSFKKEVIHQINLATNFLNNYSKNRTKYLQQAKNDSHFLEIMGFHNAFLFRRIEKDKIPIQELLAYLNEFKGVVSESLHTTTIPNVFYLNINDSDLIIVDHSGETNKLQITTKNSNKKLTLENISKITCLNNGTKNYYLFSAYEKDQLFDSQLNLIER